MSNVSSALKVTSIDEDGGYLVRGTLDVETARVATLDYMLRDEGRDPADYPDGLNPPPVLRSGLFRWTPCNERSCYDGGGHSGHMKYEDKRGRGVFEGVYLSW